MTRAATRRPWCPAYVATAFRFDGNVAGNSRAAAVVTPKTVDGTERRSFPAAGDAGAALIAPTHQTLVTAASTASPITVFDLDDLGVSYNDHQAVRHVDLRIGERQITALGPSGCGKSTVLRCFNRMNDLIPGTSVQDSCASK